MSYTGSYPLHSTYRAGLAPVVVGDRRKARMAAALRYDGKSRDWAVDADGRIRSVHPVDAAVALSILHAKGTFRSDIRIGNDFLAIRFTGTGRDQGLVEEAVRNSFPLSELLSAGRVKIRRVEYEFSSPGKLLVAVYYRNEELGQNDRAIYES